MSRQSIFWLYKWWNSGLLWLSVTIKVKTLDPNEQSLKLTVIFAISLVLNILKHLESKILLKLSVEWNNGEGLNSTFTKFGEHSYNNLPSIACSNECWEIAEYNKIWK